MNDPMDSSANNYPRNLLPLPIKLHSSDKLSCPLRFLPTTLTLLSWMGSPRLASRTSLSPTTKYQFFSRIIYHAEFLGRHRVECRRRLSAWFDLDAQTTRNRKASQHSRLRIWVPHVWQYSKVLCPDGLCHEHATLQWLGKPVSWFLLL